jgi:hypothetical protein
VMERKSLAIHRSGWAVPSGERAGLQRAIGASPGVRPSYAGAMPI